MIRPSWKGHLRLSLVSVPVQAVSTTAPAGGEIHFHQLHDKCHSRIKYKKVCPIHGEVSSAEIVSGYEYAKGKYVVVEADERESAAGENDRAISIDTFVSPADIDPLYFDGRSYYLIPDGAAGRKPYGVLSTAMEKQARYAVATCVFSRRTHLVVVRALDGLLVMNLLKYASQLKAPQTVRDDLPATASTGSELKLAQTLISASTAKHFDLSRYVDDYTDRLSETIEAKVKGKQVVAPPAGDAPPVINLMDALRKSVGIAKPGSRGRQATQHARSAGGKRKKA